MSEIGETIVKAAFFPLFGFSILAFLMLVDTGI